MMLRSLSRPLERCLGLRVGGGDSLMWHSDLKPHASGDYSVVAVQANNNLEEQNQVFTSPLASYVGVYDGHGGPEASIFINKHLFPFLHKFSTEQGGLSADVIKKAFKATEEEFLHLVKRSCCLVGAFSNDVLYVANLGVSRTVLGKRASDYKENMVVAERLSTDHNLCVARPMGEGIAKRLVRAALEEVAKKRLMGYAEIKNIRKGSKRRFHVVYLDQQSDSRGSRVKHSALGCTTAPVDI